MENYKSVKNLIGRYTGLIHACEQKGLSKNNPAVKMYHRKLDSLYYMIGLI